MGLVLLIILWGLFFGIIFGWFKDGKKGAAEYGQIGLGCSMFFLQFLKLAMPIITIIFVLFLIIKGCSN